MEILPGFDMKWWIILLIVWSLIWQGIALWKSGRNNQLTWFIVLFLVHTVGILDIIYLKFYQTKESKDGQSIQSAG